MGALSAVKKEREAVGVNNKCEQDRSIEDGKIFATNEGDLRCRSSSQSVSEKEQEKGVKTNINKSESRPSELRSVKENNPTKGSAQEAQHSCRFGLRVREPQKSAGGLHKYIELMDIFFSD